MYGDLVPEFGLLASQGRSEDLLAVFRSLLRLEPWNKELQANYYYLGLLHESVERPMAIGALISLLDEDPERAAARSSLVFGLLMEGKGAEALGELAKIETNKGVSPMMMKALEGAAKVVSGEVDAGRLVLSGVSWDLFMPQERRAVLRILRKWDAEELPLPELAQEDVVALPKEIPAWRKALEDREAELDESELPRLELPKMPKIIDIENIR